LDNFLSKMELGYSKYSNPYHNLLHGADVAQTAATICSQSGLVVGITGITSFIFRMSF
jgi:calcium/calmodulin-dependent 3',5'-cyclic nucleotide phosphodiesterase